MNEFLIVALAHLLAVVSPGPDFAMVAQNSLVHSRKTGILAAFGLALGIMVHVTYSLLGIGFIISRSIVLFNLIKYAGAAYLIWIGIQSLRAKKETVTDEDKEVAKSDIKPSNAIKMGFLTNVLNPKATLFFLALFTQVIDAQTAIGLKVLYGGEMVVVTFLWFAFVASVLSHGSVRKRVRSIKHHIERAFGVILVGLGLKVAFSVE